MSAGERRAFLKSLTPLEAKRLRYDWNFWARDNQLTPPGDWRTWLLKMGRGAGKTRTGAEWIRQRVDQGFKYIAFIAATAADARDTMVEGESGILAISPPWNTPTYEPSKRRLTWPGGARATLFSAEKPRQLRGPQHDTIWADELAAWQYPETWDMAMMGLRLSNDPRVVVTTTPRPTKIVKSLIYQMDNNGQILKDVNGRELLNPTSVVTSGSTYENIDNLAPQFIDEVIRKYEGTRLGRQELMADILTDVEGALWTYDLIEKARSAAPKQYKRIVIAVDPAVTSEEGSDETGIIVAGVDQFGVGYIIEDLSCKASPATWAKKAIDAYQRYMADAIVAEVNQGGDLIKHTIKSIAPGTHVKDVRATKGKYTRAEPVAALYEQNKVKHVGVFPSLEDQLCNWVQGENSPDRLDALVWAITDLMLDSYSSNSSGIIGFNRK